MPLTELIDSLAGVRRHYGQKSGILQRNHPHCRQAHPCGYQEMVQLAAQAASAHTFKEAALPAIAPPLLRHRPGHRAGPRGGRRPGTDGRHHDPRRRGPPPRLPGPPGPGGQRSRPRRYLGPGTGFRGMPLDGGQASRHQVALRDGCGIWKPNGRPVGTFGSE